MKFVTIAGLPGVSVISINGKTIDAKIVGSGPAELMLNSSRR